MDDPKRDPQQQGLVKPQPPPNVSGELSVSGTTPAPESDDDTLQNAQNVGEQMDENPEHPEQVDLGRDINKAEEEIKES